MVYLSSVGTGADSGGISMQARFVVLFLGVCALSMVASSQPAALDPKLVGNRFAPLTWAEMSEAQQTMMRHVLDGPRTAMGGPFNVMLRSPVMGDLAQELGAQIRFSSSLPGALREMAIMSTRCPTACSPSCQRC